LGLPVSLIEKSFAITGLLGAAIELNLNGTTANDRSGWVVYPYFKFRLHLVLMQRRSLGEPRKWRGLPTASGRAMATHDRDRRKVLQIVDLPDRSSLPCSLPLVRHDEIPIRNVDLPVRSKTKVN
jgi:hypothetical protein